MNETNTNIDLSVIIVNYNVEYFLEQCLNSVFQATGDLKVEVFVVDNNSIDGSVQMIENRFKSVRLVKNTSNNGFSKANNQAIKMAQGRYVLLLNPDTVVEESTFKMVVSFMDEHENAGGLGVRMVDGQGIFLPESKRGLPTPGVAFCKIFGLSNLFPKSRIFNSYHLGYLNENETNKVDILSGAFLLVRKEVCEKIGMLDESFFMYGEDIDFSYRITQAGYDNYYYPETSIIHYKGESTKKSSVNYVFIFYKAMIIFAKKHFSKNNAALFSWAIHLAIYFRAFLAILNRFIKFSLPVLIDFIIIASGLIAMTNHWKKIDIHFPDFVFNVSIPVYSLIWVFCSLFFGVYDKESKSTSILKSSLFGTVIILISYALLPKDYQFSRAFILLGALWVFSSHVIKKSLIHLFKYDSLRFNYSKTKNFIIVGDAVETKRVSALLKGTYSNVGEQLFVSTEKNPNSEIIKTLHTKQPRTGKYNEIIFCAKNMNPSEIITCMSNIGKRDINFKIAQPDTSFIIGSNSTDSKGDLYSMKINAIRRPENLRSKRLFDIAMSSFCLLTLPLTIWLYKNKLKFIQNSWNVFLGKKSFVGFHVRSNTNTHDTLLPTMKKGILTPLSGISDSNQEVVDQINILYAKEYSILNDAIILFKKWRFLDL